MNENTPKDISHLAQGGHRFGFPKVDGNALTMTPEERELEDVIDKMEGVEDEEFDFDEAQEVNKLFDALGGRQQTIRNYAKDRTLSGKARKRARKAAKN